MKVRQFLFAGFFTLLSGCPEPAPAPPPEDASGLTDLAGDTGPDAAAPTDVVVKDNAGPVDNGPITTPDVEPTDAGSPDAASDDAGADVSAADADLCADGGCPTCTGTQRLCGRVCAEATNPAYGCGDPMCTPCRYANAAATCAMGMCAMGACNAGFADCDEDDANGCETNVATNTDNCGMCGRSCDVDGADRVACMAGMCSIVACAAGRGNCDGMNANGCEVDLTSAVANCGMCGTRCTTPNATPDCDTGRCAIADCNPGFANCNMSVADGCETNINTDITHCGDCTTRCTYAHATGTCTLGVCALGTCEMNFGNCDGDPGNGCETDLLRAPLSCGRCGAAPCPEVCSNGTCALCNSGTAGLTCNGGGICRCAGGMCACMGGA